jgi:hypothetical protein
VREQMEIDCVIYLEPDVDHQPSDTSTASPSTREEHTTA